MANAIANAMTTKTHDHGRHKMSELYMNTEEFAALVVNALDEQDYFKRGVKAHPDDIANAFAALSETIGTALSWAVSKENQVKQKKNAVMQTTNLKKDNSSTLNYYDNIYNSGTGSMSLPIDPDFNPIEEVPAMHEDEELGYNEMKWVKRNDGLL
jgi:hypothetical protein